MNEFQSKSLFYNKFYSIYRKNTVGFQDFEFISMIGNGAFGRVWLVKRKNVNDFYAMKIVNVIDKVLAK